MPAEEFTGKTTIGKYGDFVTQVDDVVGQIVKALKDSGQWNDTLFIFTSDHGSPEIKLTGPGLFDLDKDPSEQTNLHDNNPERVRELASLLQGFQKQYADKK